MKSKVSLTLSLILFCWCANVQAETSVWDGTSYDLSWYTGSSESTYYIRTATDLAGLSYCFSKGAYLHGNFEGKTIVLENDIDLDGHEWTPIGFISSPSAYYEFAGTFDGNNHTIKGLSITQHTGRNVYVGLFSANFTNSFEVRNLRVEGEIRLQDFAYLSEGECVCVGGIIGYTWAGAMENCQSNVNITVDMSDSPSCRLICGGIVGHIELSNITDLCKGNVSRGNINVVLNTACEASIGGIIGQSNCYKAVISNCASESSISVKGGKSPKAGGVVGQIDCVKIENVLFSGSISLGNTNNGYGGGILGGDYSSPNYFEYCLMTGKLTQTGGTAHMGPFVGDAFKETMGTTCYYSEAITSPSAFGTAVSVEDLKSGKPLYGFDTSVWDFNQGAYPLLHLMNIVYAISVPTANGRVSFCVKDGGSATIRLDADEGWLLKAFYVDGDDRTINVENGLYTFGTVTEDHVVSAVYESDPSGIRTAKNGLTPQVVLSDAHHVTINPTNSNTNILVYDMNGKMVRTMNASSSTTLQLEAGLYVIKVGDSTYKVSL